MSICHFCGTDFPVDGTTKPYLEWFNTYMKPQFRQLGASPMFMQAVISRTQDGPICQSCFLTRLDSFMNYYMSLQFSSQICNFCGTGPHYQLLPNLKVKVNKVDLQTYPNSSIMLCPRCKENSKQCPTCNEVYNSNVFISRDGYCSSCYPYNPFPVLPHNYEAQPIFHPFPSKKKLYLGMEIEVTLGEVDPDDDLTARNFIAKLIANQIHWNRYHDRSMPEYNTEYYFKHDGSVRPGFELVTHPMTYHYIKDRFPLSTVLNSFRQVVPDIDTYIANHSACGIHIHASRAALTRLQIYKIASFVYTNHENMSLIGGRPYNRYCQNQIKKGYDPHSGRSLFRGYLAEQIQYREQSNKAFRYFMLNLIPKNTIEFRFFKSTLDVDIIYSYLELITSLVEWVTMVPIGETRWSEFYKFLVSKKKRYPYLLTRIQNIGVRTFYDVSDSVYGISKNKGDRGWVDELRNKHFDELLRSPQFDDLYEEPIYDYGPDDAEDF